MSISKDAALNLKNAALAQDEAAAHLRVAGDFTEGVVEAAAADYLEKSAALQDAKDACISEYDGDPAEADAEGETGVEHAEDVAAEATGRDAGGNEHETTSEDDESGTGDAKEPDTGKSGSKTKTGK